MEGCIGRGGGGFNLKFEAQSTGKESWRRRGVGYQYNGNLLDGLVGRTSISRMVGRVGLTGYPKKRRVGLAGYPGEGWIDWISRRERVGLTGYLGEKELD